MKLDKHTLRKSEKSKRQYFHSSLYAEFSKHCELSSRTQRRNITPNEWLKHINHYSLFNIYFYIYIRFLFKQCKMKQKPSYSTVYEWEMQIARSQHFPRTPRYPIILQDTTYFPVFRVHSRYNEEVTYLLRTV